MAIKGGVPKAPSQPPESERDSERADFIEGGPGKRTFPWRLKHIREDLSVQVNVKQPEKLMVQVQWIADQLGIPKRKAIEDALRMYVAAEFRRRGIKD